MKKNIIFFNQKCEIFRISIKPIVAVFLHIPLFFYPLFSASNTVPELTRATEPIILDGQLGEAVWRNTEPFRLIMYQPTFGEPPSEASDIRIAYDDFYLYISAHMFESDPEGIRINSLYRDRSNGDDTFTLIIDTFNDKENALMFWTNPAGIRGDAALSQDGGNINFSWNTYWDTAVSRNETGWIVEMQIPFSSLGFQAGRDKVLVGLIFSRYIGRKNETQVFPPISPDWRITTPSQAKEFVLKNITSQKPVYITPYVLGGFGQAAELNSERSGYLFPLNKSYNLGIDAKYNFTSNLTLDMTVNTDFAQVEADDQMVNLTRFSLFFPEKRQFFQERAGIFSFPTAVWSPDRLFHSRRIGIHQGESIPILGGARLVGRIGSWDLGFLNMQTEKSRFLPSENFGVFRIRRQVINPYSYAGGIFTSRVGTDGSYNFAYGLDGIFRIFRHEYLQLRWAQTAEEGSLKTGSLGFIDDSMFHVSWQRRSQAGLSYFASVNRTGQGFEPEMGYTTRNGVTEYVWRFSYDFLMERESRFRQLSPFQIFGYAVRRHSGGSFESAQLEYDTDFVFKSGASLWADGELYYEELPSDLPFPAGTHIPAGRYTFAKIEGGYNMAPGRLLRSNFRLGYGKFFDGTRSEVSLQSIWNISSHLELNAVYSLNSVRFSGRNQGFDSHILQIRIRSALNRKLSLNGFVQYNHLEHLLASNLRIRYNFREGTDLWLVYNEGMNMERERVYPFLPRLRDRTLLVKYTYTFKL